MHGSKFKDKNGKDVFILFDEASSYWMIAYDYTIVDEIYKSWEEARKFLLDHDCKEWED